jgi:hypothetical protein
MSEKILLLGDDSPSRQTIAEFLREEGFEVIEGSNIRPAMFSTNALASIVCYRRLINGLKVWANGNAAQS